MAGITFLYRSKKDEINLTLRLRFSHNKKEFNIDGNSRIEVTRDYWYDVHKKTIIRDAGKRTEKARIENNTLELESFILNEFNKVKEEVVDKKWLESRIESYYNPKIEEKIPSRIYDYIDYFLEYRKQDISIPNRKKYITLKGKLLKIEKYWGKKIYFEDINESFRKVFEEFYDKNRYAENTLSREFTTLKTLCNHSRSLGVHSNISYENLNFKRKQKENIIYLNEEELDVLSSLQFKPSEKYLEDSRDWLLISCCTGQRISDFMRFTKDFINDIEEVKMLQFRQKKTKKVISIPIGKSLEKILNKREGNFPDPVNEQVYNRHLKKIGELAELNEIVKGKLRKSTDLGKRDVEVEAEKYKFLTSHIGRRTFATLYYGKMPTYLLKEITGHSTEAMLLVYIGKSSSAQAVEAAKYINKVF